MLDRSRFPTFIIIQSYYNILYIWLFIIADVWFIRLPKMGQFVRYVLLFAGSWNLSVRLFGGTFSYMMVKWPLITFPIVFYNDLSLTWPYNSISFTDWPYYRLSWYYLGITIEFKAMTRSYLKSSRISVAQYIIICDTDKICQHF